MKYGWVKNVCVLDSLHGLLQYFLLVSEEEVNHTFFFWSEGVSDVIKGHFIGHYRDLLKNRHYYRTQLVFEYPFLLKRGLNYWGHDHLTYSKYIFRKKPFSLLEDGTLNYVPYPWRKKYTLKKRIRSMWAGPLYCMDVPYAGYEYSCKSIHLTGLTSTGEVYSSPKLSVRSFQSMWDESSLEKRNFVNNLFGLEKERCEQLASCKKILLTQPLSEDGYITEIEKIAIYAKILERVGTENLLIKPHPREVSDYKRYFPDACVFDQSVPMQLLTLNGIRFEEAYTLFSSAVFDFPYHIRVWFVGSRISASLYQQFPLQNREFYASKEGMVEWLDWLPDGGLNV